MHDMFCPCILNFLWILPLYNFFFRFYLAIINIIKVFIIHSIKSCYVRCHVSKIYLSNQKKIKVEI
jgi:hypothetical protein